MSTEVPKPPQTDPPVDPDNWHTDGSPEVPAEDLLTGKPKEIKPDNWHTDGTTK